MLKSSRKALAMARWSLADMRMEYGLRLRCSAECGVANSAGWVTGGTITERNS